MKLYINKKKDFETFLKLLETNTGEDLYKKGIFVVPLKKDIGDPDPEDPTTLRGLIKMMIEKDGNDCNLNFIDVSGREDVNSLFVDKPDFNGDISKWDVSNVKYFRRTFFGSKFNGDISKWDVSSGEDFDGMFFDSEFNGDISKWDVSSGEDFTGMFTYSKFNGDISKWDVSNGTNFASMFRYSKFNRDISKWDVSSGTNFSFMFFKSKFNGDISKWDVSSGTNFCHMFSQSKFNRDISKWKIDPESYIENMYEKCKIKIEYMAKKPSVVSKDKLSKILTKIQYYLDNTKLFSSDYVIKNGRCYIRIFSETPIDMSIIEKYKNKSQDFERLYSLMSYLQEEPLKIEIFNDKIIASAKLV